MDRSHIPMAKPNADLIYGVDAINNCGAGAYGNQGIHIGGAME